MATMKVVLALACAAVLGAPAAAADNLRGVEVAQEASHTRTLQAVTDLCGEAGEKPCADGCANGFKLHEDGLCVMNLGRSMLQSFVGISGSSTASIGGGKKANRRGKGKGKKNNRRGKGKKNNRRGKNNKRNNRRGKKNNRRGKGKNGNTRRPTASGSAEFTATASGNGPASAGGTTFVSVNSGRSSVTTSTSVFGFAGATPGGAPPPPLTGPPGMYGGGPPPLNGPPGMYGGKTAAPPTITPITPAPVAKPACAGQCATNWGRCAGQGIQGVRACCDSDYECVERTSGFAQCRPKASSQFALKWKLSSAGNVLQCTSNHN